MTENENGKLRVDLSDDGLPGQWLELVDIRTKSPKQFRELKQIPSDPEDLAALAPEQATDAARSFIAMGVRKWNLTDPDTGLALPAPDSPDLDPDAIPFGATARIKAEIASQIEDIQNLKARSRSG